MWKGGERRGGGGDLPGTVVLNWGSPTAAPGSRTEQLGVTGRCSRRQDGARGGATGSGGGKGKVRNRTWERRRTKEEGSAEEGRLAGGGESERHGCAGLGRTRAEANPEE